MTKKQTDDPGDKVKKDQARIRREFKHLETSENIAADFALSQANEICSYLNRVMLTPFTAWESFLLVAIEKDEEDFFYRFYLQRNEFGVIEPDYIRINQMRVNKCV